MNEPTLFDVPSRPVDEDRAALLQLIAGDPLHARDRERIVSAILYVAAHNAGKVDPNIVRARLTDPDTGELTVFPRVIGSIYHVLSSQDVLIMDGWTPSTDRRGGNYGKPCRVYRLIRRVAA